MLLPFCPSAATVKVTANNTPTSVSGTLAFAAPQAPSNVRVFNSGTVAVFVKLNGSTATATDLPVGAGQERVFTFGGTAVAVLSFTTTSADVYFTPGEGA